MVADPVLSSFITSSFRSVWTIELLLHMKRAPDRDWTNLELVQTLRASDLVIANGLRSLEAAGLVVETREGASRYAPASEEIASLADATEALYSRRPDSVRRMIVAATSDGLAAFADAFRLRRD